MTGDRARTASFWLLSAIVNLVLGFVVIFPVIMLVAGLAEHSDDGERAIGLVLGGGGIAAVLGIFVLFNRLTSRWADDFAPRYWLVSLVLLVAPLLTFMVWPDLLRQLVG